MHVFEHQRIVVIKGDDHVVAPLLAVGLQVAEAQEKCRDVDDVAGRKIRNARRAAPILEYNQIIATAEEELAGEDAAPAEHKRIVAIAQKYVAHDVSAIDHGLLPGTAENRDAGPLDAAEILQERGRIRIGKDISLQDVQLNGRRIRVLALDDA